MIKKIEASSIESPPRAWGALNPDQESESLRSRAGYGFSEDDAIWEIEKNVTINVSKICEKLDTDVRRGFLKTLAHYATNYSSGHTKTISERMHYMMRESNASKISVPMLISYRSTLKRETEWYLGTLRGFLYKWHKLGNPGVTEDVVDLLKGWRLKGNIKGDSVKRMDPRDGPLTDNELLGFNEGAVRAFEMDRIGIDDLALALMSSHTGRRPRQIAHTKLGDLDGALKNKKGEPMYLIRIPRAKQRGEAFRNSFKDFAMTQELWAVLEAQRKLTIELVERKLGFKLQSADQGLLPLFPDLDAFDGVTSIQDLQGLLASDRLHLAPNQVTALLRKVVSISRCHSERTGELLDIVATRFRYTTGTRAAREGFGPMVIAELLDHSDMQSAGVYVKNIPENVAALDKAVGFQLAPFAQAFQGVLVNREEDADRGNDSSSRIRHKGQGAGTCGTRSYCGANVPIPCYTCMHFQPWLDGPHEVVYEDLLKDRERIQQITGDATIASVNDRTILAVAQVIQLCSARRNATSKEDASG